MRTLAAVLLLLLAVPLFAGDDPRIAEGIALHDAGKYDEAIEKYKAVLAGSPKNKMALYEMAYAYQAKGYYAECRNTLEPVVNDRDPMQVMILAVFGNCLDLMGDSNRAINAYRKGLKIAPDDTQLLYNLAVALTGQRKHAEARKVLKKELELRPGHGSGHFLLAQIFEVEGFRGPAILEYLRLLAAEYGTDRARAAAQNLVALLNVGVEKKSEGNINLTIDPKSRTEEGDFKGWEMMLAIAAAGRFTEEQKSLSEFEKTRVQLASSLRMLIEAPPQGQSWAVRQNVPFFAQLEEKKLLDTFAGIAIASLRLEGSAEWGNANGEAIREYAAFAARLPR